MYILSGVNPQCVDSASVFIASRLINRLNSTETVTKRSLPANRDNSLGVNLSNYPNIITPYQTVRRAKTEPE